MWILISWLRQKPADLDLQCFQKRINPGSAAQGFSFYFQVMPSKLIPVSIIESHFLFNDTLEQCPP